MGSCGGVKIIVKKLLVLASQLPLFFFIVLSFNSYYFHCFLFPFSGLRCIVLFLGYRSLILFKLVYS